MRKTKIVVPIMPRTLEELESLDLDLFAKTDLIEWRVDYMKKSQIEVAADLIKKKFCSFPLLFTVRTANEGGFLVTTYEDYQNLILKLLSYNPDYIDIEYFSFPHILEHLSSVKEKVVLSYHNFKEMPDDLTQRLVLMNEENTAFVKAAVMPQSECDVLDLLQITRDLTLEYGAHFITMGMGDLGKISRISGYLTGSCWTFASVGEESAPGQIDLDNLARLLELFETSK